MSNKAENSGFNSIIRNKQGIKILMTGSILQLFLGILYVWSVFVIPVNKFYNWSVDSVKLTSSFMLCFFVIGILAGGKAQMKIGVKFTTLIGGLMVAAGMLATSLIPAGGNAPVFLIYTFYGIIGGFGVGAGYNAIISTAQKWFPQNRGFATGVSVCAFGLSTVVFAPLVTTLIGKFDVKYTFLILAGSFAAAVLLLFSFIKTPEQVANAAAPILKGKQYTTLEMIKTPRFYLIALSLMFGTSVFFIILPSLKELAVNRGLESFATGIVMFTGIANALGRLGAPLMSDKIGREMADVIILAATALGAFGLCFANGVLLIVIIAVVAFCYGGYSGLYPVLTSENFGIKNIGSNYGAVMVGFMLSALLFPIVIKKIDGQKLQFITLGALAAVGVVLVIILKLINLKQANNDAIGMLRAKLQEEGKINTGV
jgi:OFA family oxalate/formate antiporter-like MFS transporter